MSIIVNECGPLLLPNHRPFDYILAVALQRLLSSNSRRRRLFLILSFPRLLEVVVEATAQFFVRHLVYSTGCSISWMLLGEGWQNCILLALMSAHRNSSMRLFSEFKILRTELYLFLRLQEFAVEFNIHYLWRWILVRSFCRQHRLHPILPFFKHIRLNCVQ
jgi:hypothetical protein